ncbi:MAG TPA: asparagine synthase-related protein [Gemmatimonadales bacterium]|nr:asparagine synthase-related protein [Gemmatimonadales bacterium]
MPTILLVDDPDPDRRRRTLDRASSAIAGLDARRAASLTRGTTSVAWGKGDHTPFDRFDDDAATTLLFGDAIRDPAGARSTALDMARALSQAGDHPVCDGLHLAVSVFEHDGWAISADILGILPLYHVVLPEVRMVATSPGLFRAHERFHASLNVAALASVLIINGVLEGETIFQGVTRLGQGHTLRGRSGAPLREVPRYRIPVGSLHHDVPLEECSHRLHDALVDACARHVPTGQPHSLLLSGGLDSRLLAGILIRQRVPMIALTRGAKSDEDYRCARRVARHLGLPHRLVPDSPGDWPGFQSRLLHDGMNASPGLGAHAVGEAIRGLAPRSVSGYLMDAIIGGNHIGWCYSNPDHAAGFGAMFQRLNRLGLGLDTARALLRKDVFGESVDLVIERTRKAFEASGSTNLERAWRFDLAHRQRFHVGQVLVRQMAAAWPAAPHVDRKVLETAGGIPLGMLADRVVERDMLVRFHNDLARLPIDRGATSDTTPIDPDVLGVLRQVPARLARKVARALRIRTPERRYYHRIHALDSPGWISVRQGAEAAREAAYAWFDRQTFDTLLPPPGTLAGSAAPASDAVGKRSLLGAVTLIGAIGG